MRKLTTALCFLLIFLSSVSAQNYSFEYGIISDHEIKMETYPNDTSAEAVKIYDIGESGFYYSDYKFDLYFKRSMKIKILKDTYIDDAFLEIPLYKGGSGDPEKLNKINVTTYNFENNKLISTTLSKDQIYTEIINENWDQKRIAFPSVKKGSIVEISYEILSPHKSLLRDWEFQCDIPTVYSKYVTRMIPYYEYIYIFSGAKQFDESNDYIAPGLGFEAMGNEIQEKVWEFGMRNVPAFKDESYISSEKEYLIKLDFQLAKFFKLDGGSVEILTTWDDVINVLIKDEHFGGYINRSKAEFSKIIKNTDILSKSQNEKIDFALDYIKQNFTWNGFYGELANKSVNQFLKEKKGNIAEINLFLVGALMAFELDVHPLISSTRDNGKIVLQYPFVEPFNYVTAYLKTDNKSIVLDATDLMCPNDLIPVKCINDMGLIVKKGEVKWLNLNNIQNMSFKQNEFVVRLSPSADSLIGKCVTSATNYIAMDLRKSFQNNPENTTELFNSDLIVLNDSISTENYTQISKPYILKYTLSMEVDHIQNKYFIDPFLDVPIKENSFITEERTYPIDMVYPRTVAYKSEITVPDDFLIEKLPESFTINNDLFLLNYSLSNNNGIITVNASYQFKKAVYQPEDYAKIKRYYRMIIKYLNQKIVISKK